jgi:hypothetical protein
MVNHSLWEWKFESLWRDGLEVDNGSDGLSGDRVGGGHFCGTQLLGAGFTAEMMNCLTPVGRIIGDKTFRQPGFCLHG